MSLLYYVKMIKGNFTSVSTLCLNVRKHRKMKSNMQRFSFVLSACITSADGGLFLSR